MYQMFKILSSTPVFIYLCFLENKLNLADQQKLQQKIVTLESNLKTYTETTEKKESGKV